MHERPNEKPPVLGWPEGPESATAERPQPSRADRRRVAETLRAGGLVLLPTETVYGVAARADHAAALDRLRGLKDRDPGQALTWHVGSTDVLARFADQGPWARPLAERLAARYWPGPLTLVLRGVPAGLERAAQEGWTGVRFPAHRATARLLASLDFPVVATSANRRGAPPLTSAAAAREQFGAALALVLDGGAPRVGESSAVLRVGPGRFELLRSGLLDLDALRHTAGRRLTFVCTGNTCRSPMAEALAKHLLAERLEVAPDRLPEFGFDVASAGVFAGAGAPAAEHAVQLLAERDIDLSRHRSRPALPEELAQRDEIYALTRSHLEALRSILPPSQAKRCQLLDPRGEDVPDPIGGSLAHYQETAVRIESYLRARLEGWA